MKLLERLHNKSDKQILEFIKDNFYDKIPEIFFDEPSLFVIKRFIEDEKTFNFSIHNYNDGVIIIDVEKINFIDMHSNDQILLCKHFFYDKLNFKALKEKEYILCSAVKYMGNTICGRRHSDCYITIQNLDPKGYYNTYRNPDYDYRKFEGFMTSENIFVDRKLGWNIALENNQIKYGLKCSGNGDDSLLISENLYF